MSDQEDIFTNAQIETMQVSDCSIAMLLQALDGRCPDCFIAAYRVKDSQEKRGYRNMTHLSGEDAALSVGMAELLRHEVQSQIMVDYDGDEEEQD